MAALLEQRQLTLRQPSCMRGAARATSEKKKQIAADPLLRFAEVAELSLMRVEASIVIRTEHVVQIFVMDDRLDEVGRNVSRVQRRVNANLVRHVIVGTEANAAPRLALDLMAPTHAQHRILEKIRSMHLGRE